MPGLAPFAAFFVALVAAWLLLMPAARRIALDRPNERSLHAAPVPRTGGIAVALGVAAAWAMAGVGLQVLAVIAAALVVVSFVDDAIGLPALVRLVMHLAGAAAVLAFQVGSFDLVPMAVLVLAIAWAANLYNFMDGSDGLAGGMAVIGFGAYAIAAYGFGDAPLAALCASIAAASAAFLLFNWHPARLFLGDAGAVPLGFLAGALGVWGWSRGHWPLWFPLLVFAPFLGDATLTLAKRALRRERVWQAHRDHYYQRLVRLGFGHRRTAHIEYAAMVGCAALGLAVLRQGAAVQAVAIALAAIALGGLAAWIDLRWGRAR